MAEQSAHNALVAGSSPAGPIFGTFLKVQLSLQSGIEVINLIGTKMLKKHKNYLFERLESVCYSAYNIELSNFEVVETQSGILKIQLRNSPLIFMLRQKDDDFDFFVTNFTIFKPGFPLKETLEEFEHDQSFYDIYRVSEQIDDWLSGVDTYLKEINLPDLWTQLNTYSSFTSTSSIPHEELRQFTADEKIEIKQYLREFEERIVEKFDPLQEQLEFINERLEYLSQAVDRLNRFDWKAQAMSTLTSIAVNLGVDTQGGKKLLDLFLQGFQFLTKHLPSGS